MGGGIYRFVIEPSNEAERNIIHLLLLLPVPIVPMLPTRCSLSSLALAFSPSLTPY